MPPYCSGILIEELKMETIILKTNVGPVLIEGDGAGVRRIRIGVSETDGGGPAPTDSPVAEAAEQLAAYFSGERTEFDLRLAPEGTEFQRRVWEELVAIPYGETISYGELAKRVGNASASRAVGAANGANPLPIVVPCHRVIGANGKLTGFTAGLDVKARLLALEGFEVVDQGELF